MASRHPVGLTISMLWWGIYLGCLGASIGAGIGSLLDPGGDQATAPPPRAGTNGQHHPAQAVNGDAALPYLVTSPVRDDRNFETFVGGSEI
jgi:hypothetical protein